MLFRQETTGEVFCGLYFSHNIDFKEFTMVVELTFKNGNTIRLLEESAIVPSGDVYVRNKFEVHAPDVDMTAFVLNFSDVENLDYMQFVAYSDDTTRRELFRHVLEHYTVVSSIGRKLIESTNPNTGAKQSVYHLYAVLEQPTPIERGEPVPDPETEEIVDILLGRTE